MTKKLVPLMLATLSLCQIGATATPSADLIKKITAASGGTAAFQDLGIIRLEIDEKDSFADGTSQETEFSLTLDTTLSDMRLEMGDGQVVVVSNGDSGWALVRGKLDERKQTAHMAPKIIRKKVLPWILPFSLNQPGIYFPSSPSAATLDGQPVLKATLTVPSTFFDTPVMNTQWTLYLAKDSHRLLAAEFLPNPDFKEANKEGMHYRFKKTIDLDGVQIPSLIEVTGLDESGKRTQTKRTISISTSVVSDPSPALFLHPDKVRAFEEDE